MITVNKLIMLGVLIAKLESFFYTRSWYN